MPAPKYELRAAQVSTPIPVLRFCWELIRSHRPKLGSVLDMGAGDGRFAQYGHYKSYLGIEIDKSQMPTRNIRPNAKLQVGCVFGTKLSEHDACIGNPPYLRHHELEEPWKTKTLSALSTRIGTELGGHGNLYLYFMALALLTAKSDGLVALLVPFEWTSRPSAKGIRDVVIRERWHVSVYRFQNSIFDGVTTTASISIIDKARTDGTWDFFDVLQDFSFVRRQGLTGTGKALLPYQRKRGAVFARRGMSPGTQKVFTLTEGERIHHGLKLSDVSPCVTSLRDLPNDVGALDAQTFQEHFVEAGRRCWLIKTRGRLSERLKSYVDGIPRSQRDTATCRERTPWYRYEHVAPPRVLLHSGFSGEQPKSLANHINAIPVGAMYGIYGPARVSASAIRTLVSKSNILEAVVPHSGRLQKVEVGQLNSLLAAKWPEK